MLLKKLGNYRLLLLSSSLMAFISGIFGPFYILFLQNLGGSIEQFGFAFGLLSFTQAVTSYFAGKYSDKFGRKIFLIVGGFVAAGIVFAYTVINSLIELYALQVMYGIAYSFYIITESVFLADITKKETRGKDIGKYTAVVGAISALTMMFSGFVVGGMGFKIIFYVTALFGIASTMILFYIKE